MQNFQHKRDRRRLLYSPATLSCVIIILIMLTHAVYGMYQKKALVDANMAEALQKLQELEHRQKLLQANIARLSTDQGKEAELRARYQIARPGENTLVIIDTATSTFDNSEKNTESLSFWQVIMNILQKLRP